ncbi:BnaC01g40510D [Brassica napus]|uniref:BnaC01g40510D protein n=2 Tax=Brassica TaxID=3705 RepID=A0A078GXK9_BRANA|nr:BnaC01g40510D [Brassica napus]VDD53421.1 unnamed protein product [Brassica oleracea]
MTKNVKKATPEFATSQTIATNGRLTIIGIGNLEGVPLDFLKALSSGGVVIKQLSLGSHVNEDVLDAFYSNVPPLSMMIITAAHAEVLGDVVCEFYNRGSCYNLLLAYPAVTEHADPEPSSLLVDNFGGQLLEIEEEAEFSLPKNAPTMSS